MFVRSATRHYRPLPSNKPGNLTMLAAIRRASSRVISLVTAANTLHGAGIDADFIATAALTGKRQANINNAKIGPITFGLLLIRPSRYLRDNSEAAPRLKSVHRPVFRIAIASKSSR